MATSAELAVRVLRKLKVIGSTETASAEDLALAIEGITEAHAVLEVAGLLRWTLADIPTVAELGYVHMAAYLKADDFVQTKDPAWMQQGMRQIQGAVNLPAEGATYAPNF